MVSPRAQRQGGARALLLFALGSLAYVWRASIPISLAAAAIAIALVAWNPAALTRGTLFAPLLAYVVLVLAYHPRLQWHGFNRVGDYSYGLYVYSFPLQQTLMQRFPSLEPAGSSRARCRSPLRSLHCPGTRWKRLRSH
jgi:peptidoglycan/LPS O-acetylase OafA/YrhL